MRETGKRSIYYENIAQEIASMSPSEAAKDYVRCEHFIEQYQPKVDERRIPILLILMMLSVAVVGGLVYTSTKNIVAMLVAIVATTIISLLGVFMDYRPVKKRLKECRFRQYRHSMSVNSWVIEELKGMSDAERRRKIDELTYEEEMAKAKERVGTAETPDVVGKIEAGLLKQLDEVVQEEEDEISIKEEIKTKTLEGEAAETSKGKNHLGEEASSAVEDKPEEDDDEAMEKFVAEVDAAIAAAQSSTTKEEDALPTVDVKAAKSLAEFQHLFDKYWSLE